jgi:hypothetical protein
MLFSSHYSEVNQSKSFRRSVEFIMLPLWRWTHGTEGAEIVTKTIRNTGPCAEGLLVVNSPIWWEIFRMHFPSFGCTQFKILCTR